MSEFVFHPRQLIYGCQIREEGCIINYIRALMHTMAYLGVGAAKGVLFYRVFVSMKAGLL